MKQTTARVLLNIQGDEKSYFLANGTEIYYEKLRTAYKDIKENKENDYLYFSFFTLCAATLEYSLNYTLADFCVKHFGPYDYKKYAEGYIKLSLPQKLLMTPTIVSNGKYKFKENNLDLITLNELITLRNRILHNKEFLREFKTPPIKDLKEIIEIKLVVETNHIDTLNKKNCLKYGESLGKFKTLFMTPALNNRLSSNELVLEF